MKKQYIIIAIVVLLVLVGSAAFAAKQFLAGPKDSAQTTNKKKIAEPVNIIPVAERPYIRISPEADGRNISIRISDIKKEAKSVDYELEYQSGELLQGVFGTLDLSSLPAETKQLMGSCSAGGKCSYHEDVKGGTMLTRYSGGAENYALKSDWKYIENTAKETQVSSKDAKFQLESATLGKTPFIVVFNTAGYPEGLEGTVASEIYSLTASQALTGTGTLTIRANEDAPTAIMGWDGKAWKKFEGTVDGKAITAEVNMMELYVAVK